MSSPLCFTVPEMLHVERRRRVEHSDVLALELDPSTSPGEHATATADAHQTGATPWDTSKSDVWQIGMIAFTLLSGEMPPHSFFSTTTADAEFGRPLNEVSGVREEQTEGDPQGVDYADGGNLRIDAARSPRGVRTSPRLRFSGECWLDVSESGRTFYIE
jgi:hypothetical protein